MPYPVIFTEFANAGSYANEIAVQRLLTTYQIDNARVESPDQGGVANVRRFLIQISAEIDAALLNQGVLVPPPAGTPILAILEQYAAFGAAALLEYARYEGDESIGSGRANTFNTLYDNGLAMLERGDINLIQMGCINGGWAIQADRRKRYRSGNLEPLSDGTAKKPVFTMTMDW